MLGTIASLDLVWSAADTFNGLMAIPNLIALVLLSGVIAKETKDFLLFGCGGCAGGGIERAARGEVGGFVAVNAGVVAV